MSEARGRVGCSLRTALMSSTDSLVFQEKPKKTEDTWKAFIRRHGKTVQLGVWTTREQAAQAFDLAAMAHGVRSQLKDSHHLMQEHLPALQTFPRQSLALKNLHHLPK